MTLVIDDPEFEAILTEVAERKGVTILQALYDVMVTTFWSLLLKSNDPVEKREIRKILRESKAPEPEVNNFKRRLLP